MCDLGESIAIEAIQNKNIEYVRNIIDELNCSLQRAMDILKLSEDERKNIEKYFQS